MRNNEYYQALVRTRRSLSRNERKIIAMPSKDVFCPGGSKKAGSRNLETKESKIDHDNGIPSVTSVVPRYTLMALIGRRDNTDGIDWSP